MIHMKFNQGMYMDCKEYLKVMLVGTKANKHTKCVLFGWIQVSEDDSLPLRAGLIALCLLIRLRFTACPHQTCLIIFLTSRWNMTHEPPAAVQGDSYPIRPSKLESLKHASHIITVNLTL